MLEGITGDAFPASFSDADALLVGTGRRAPVAEERAGPGDSAQGFRSSSAARPGSAHSTVVSRGRTAGGRAARGQAVVCSAMDTAVEVSVVATTVTVSPVARSDLVTVDWVVPGPPPIAA